MSEEIKKAIVSDVDVDDKVLEEKKEVKVEEKKTTSIKALGPAFGLTLPGIPFWVGPDGWGLFKIGGERYNVTTFQPTETD